MDYKQRIKELQEYLDDVADHSSEDEAEMLCGYIGDLDRLLQKNANLCGALKNMIFWAEESPLNNDCADYRECKQCREEIKIAETTLADNNLDGEVEE